ncbi:putative disease resistance protein [Vitis vinifera]|uniref:Putative disease resistance protein n=1 Tax=Vitis vinifera TaxID=29760 RepID=A0A438FRV2_VITVI|nr:putative disease resistance protein [Vitis vinifera]
MEPEQSRRQHSDSDGLSAGLGWDGAKDSDLYSYIKMKAQVLNRNKDVVCLILSYPPVNLVKRGRHEVWIQDVMKINEMVREMEAPSEKKAMDALEISSQITRLLDHTWDDIEAYVPREIIDKMCKKTLEVDMSVKEVTMRPLSTGSTKQEAIPLAMSQDDIEIEMTAGVARHDEKRPMQEKLLSLVVDFSMRQILQEIENPELLRIGISGRDGVRVTSALLNLPKIRETFDVVIQVDCSLHSTSTAFEENITAFEENIAAQLGLSTWARPALDEYLKGTNFLIVLGNIHDRMELYKLGTNWWNSKKIQKIVSMTRFHDVHQRMLLDLEISMDNHLLSWELFCLNVGDIVHSSVIQRLAIHAVKECKGHLLAIVLLARALKKVNEVHIWEYASHAPALRPASQMKDEVLFNTLAFICGRLGGLIGKLDEGEKIVCDLVNAFLLEGGKGLTELPKDEAWEKATEVHLMSNKLSELPKSPDCPELRILFLQINHHLRVIPPDFLLRGCRLLMELPPEVENLAILRKNNQSNTMIPQNVISKLLQLEELSIYVNPDDERWNVTVKDIVKEVCNLKRLEALKLYLPEVVLLNDFMGNGTSPINLSLLNFRFIVGSHSKRFISRLPHEIAVKFEQQERCLKYVNGEGVPVEIKEALQHATALILDRHISLTKLSEFGIGNIKNLEFCVLGECSQIESIVDGAEIYTQGDVCAEIILGSLQYLRLHYMKNLRSIWKGPIQRGCLSNLKSLELHACPYLTTVFTLDLLENLHILEELVVERCPEIYSVVTHEVPVEHRRFPLVTYLPKLKKLSLHYMPKLVSISSGLRIAPTLEWMSFYNCPSLQTLSDMEVSSNNLKVIIGQADWWRALKWGTSAFGYVLLCDLDSIFVPIKQNIDLMTQLAELGIQLVSPKQERKPSQQSGSNGSVKAPAVEEGTTLEEIQLYETSPLSPVSIEEGGSIEAPAVDAGTTSKGKQLYEPASLPFPTQGSDSMKAPAVEGGTMSEEKQLYEPVPLPFPREGGDSMKALQWRPEPP